MSDPLRFAKSKAEIFIKINQEMINVRIVSSFFLIKVSYDGCLIFNSNITIWLLIIHPLCCGGVEAAILSHIALVIILLLPRQH